MSEFAPRPSLQQLHENFSDIAPALTPNEARAEASRCLFCYDAPCIQACPTKINIPQFIQQIANADTLGAAKTIFAENILGGSCGRACPTSVLCEGACVYNALNKKPIEIGRLQRFATDVAIDQGVQFWKRGNPSGKRIAIVGAGPAGLSCAYELAKEGHAVTVYEAAPKAGGLNTYGLAAYKIETEFALKEAAYIKAIGIDLRLNSPVGKDPSVTQLLNDYDAVFLAVGMGPTAALSIPGENLEGCLEALEFIKPTREPNFSGARVGANVLVIGGGNTAIDVATAAKRLGAENVTIVYRRTAAEMPAFEYEYELAKADGVAFRWLTAPLEVIGAAGRVSGLKCVRCESAPNAHGKSGLRNVPNSEHIIPCDMVVKALGQQPLRVLLAEIQGLELNGDAVKVDPATATTSVPKLFAAGDCVAVGEVVDAVQGGKIAARGINHFLNSERR